MKKLLSLIFIVPLLAFSQSDNINTSFGNVGYKSVTLTTAIDTADILPAGQNGKKFDFITVVGYSSAVDTVQVFTQAKHDTSIWVQKALTDMTSNTTVTTIILSTTKKEWLIVDPQPFRVRLISTSNDGSTSTLITQGKYGIK
jgi:hypothetical protein